MELNTEWTIKALRNAEVVGIFKSQAAFLQIFFESKNEDKKEKAQMLDVVKKS